MDQLKPYDPAELIPQKGDAAMARAALEEGRRVLALTEFTHDTLDAALRASAQSLKIKAEADVIKEIEISDHDWKVLLPDPKFLRLIEETNKSYQEKITQIMNLK